MLTPPLTKTGENWLDMKKVQDRAQLLGKTLYHQGDLSYFEAVNKEILKNAYQRFEEEGMIVVIKSKDAKVPSTVRLADDWTPSRCPKTGRIMAKGKLWTFSELISLSRREGKNRRDGATVQNRVLALVDKVGRQLWEDAAAQDQLVGEDEARIAKAIGKRKRKALNIDRAKL